jgi:hypothetical protein
MPTTRPSYFQFNHLDAIEAAKVEKEHQRYSDIQLRVRKILGQPKRTFWQWLTRQEIPSVDDTGEAWWYRFNTKDIFGRDVQHIYRVLDRDSLDGEEFYLTYTVNGALRLEYTARTLDEAIEVAKRHRRRHDK